MIPGFNRYIYIYVHIFIYIHTHTYIYIRVGKGVNGPEPLIILVGFRIDPG